MLIPDEPDAALDVRLWLNGFAMIEMEPYRRLDCLHRTARSVARRLSLAISRTMRYLLWGLLGTGAGHGAVPTRNTASPTAALTARSAKAGP